MYMQPRLAVLLGVTLIGAGCYRSPPPPSPTTDLTTSSVAFPASRSAETTTSTKDTDSVEHCPPQDGRRIDITAGVVGCAEAYSVVAAYDFSAGKYQQIQDYTCYTGTAQTAPVVLVCSSGGTEFAVYDQ